METNIPFISLETNFPLETKIPKMLETKVPKSLGDEISRDKNSGTHQEKSTDIKIRRYDNTEKLCY